MFETSLTRPNAAIRLAGRDPFFSLFDRFLNDDFIGGLVNRAENETQGWMPPVDLIENDTAFVATVDLPGLTKKDVEVSLEDNVLTLSGERNFENKEGNGTKFRRIERSYGAFRRAFTLPPGVDVGKVEALFKDGVLTLTLPKSETAKPRKISIS